MTRSKSLDACLCVQIGYLIATKGNKMRKTHLKKKAKMKRIRVRIKMKTKAMINKIAIAMKIIAQKT